MLHARALVAVQTAVTLALCLVVPRTHADDGRQAAGEIEIRRVPNGGIQPEGAIDVKGDLQLIYFAGDPAGGDVFYVRSADAGRSFSTPVRVNSQPGSAIAVGTIRGGQLAVGRSGRVHVTWNGSDKAEPRGPVNPVMKQRGAPFLYARSTPDGSGFEAQRNLAPRTFTIDGGGSVAADPQGHVYAVFHGNREGEPGTEERRAVWVARSDDDGETFAPEIMAWQRPTGVCGCCQSRAIASATSLTILYRAAANLSNRDVYALTSRDGGATFSGGVVQPWSIAACPMTSMSLASRGARVVGAWETNGQVSFADIDARSGVVGPATAAPGQPGGRKHPRLALAGSGEMLLVWTENTGWSRGGSIAWQVYDASGRPKGPLGTAPGSPVWSFATPVAKPGGGFVIFY